MTRPAGSGGHPVRVFLLDALPGVRGGLRWILEGPAAEGIAVVGEGDHPGDVAAGAAADVVVTGLRLVGANAGDAVRAGIPVVVVAWLPEDERADVDLTGVAAVVPAGALRERLAATVRSVARPARGGARAGTSSPRDL